MTSGFLTKEIGSHIVVKLVSTEGLGLPILPPGCLSTKICQASVLKIVDGRKKQETI